MRHTGTISDTHAMHRYIGLMSGTSSDGIDAALVTIHDSEAIELVATEHLEYGTDVRNRIQELMLPGENEIDRSGSLDILLGQLFAKAAQSVLDRAGLNAAAIRAIGSHGQTIRHRPDHGMPFTRQIGNPSVIAEITGITTVADFRARDMAAGGQGAPLVPAFHDVVFRSVGRNRAVVNIGGIANVTWLPGDPESPVVGFDTGPGNTLLDQWIARHRREPYDRDGNWASQGKVQDKLLAQMGNDAFFRKTPPKSTGREYFSAGWLGQILTGSEAPEDVQATLAQLTAESIAGALKKQLPEYVDEVFVCGGGVHNRDLMSRLATALMPLPVRSTSSLGFDPNWIEAIAFAWLAHRTLSGQPGNLPSVTGAKHAAVLGGIYLG